MDSLRITRKPGRGCTRGSNDGGKIGELTGRDYSGILCVVMVIVIVYVIVNDYLYYKKEDEWMVTNVGDMDKLAKMHKYDNSELYTRYNSMSDSDKVFMDDYIAHCMLEHKTRRPCFKKKYNGIIKNILISSVVYMFVFASPITKYIKQNTVNYFISNLL